MARARIRRLARATGIAEGNTIILIGGDPGDLPLPEDDAALAKSYSPVEEPSPAPVEEPAPTTVTRFKRKAQR
jgi:hypothetical protein